MIPLNQNLYALKRSAIRVFSNMARETPDCAMLTIGEPDFDTPDAIKAAAAAALTAGQTHYAANQGTPALRKAVADYESGRGNAVTPEQVLITVGATQALFTAIFGILNPGEEVPFHTHTGDCEYYYILSGAGIYSDNGTAVEVKPGLITFTPSGNGHGIQNTGTEQLEFIALIVVD